MGRACLKNHSLYNIYKQNSFKYFNNNNNNVFVLNILVLFTDITELI